MSSPVNVITVSMVHTQYLILPVQVDQYPMLFILYTDKVSYYRPGCLSSGHFLVMGY